MFATWSIYPSSSLLFINARSLESFTPKAPSPLSVFLSHFLPTFFFLQIDPFSCVQEELPVNDVLFWASPLVFSFFVLGFEVTLHVSEGPPGVCARADFLPPKPTNWIYHNETSWVIIRWLRFGCNISPLSSFFQSSTQSFLMHFFFPLSPSAQNQVFIFFFQRVGEPF